MTVPVVEVFVTFQTLAEADLTSYTKSVSVSRGRSRQLDQFNAGTATVVFDNSTRILDPLNTDSPYYPYVLPRAEIKITANEIPIFTGVVSDWDLSYDITNNDEIVAVCSDAFTVLANQALEFLKSIKRRDCRLYRQLQTLPHAKIISRHFTKQACYYCCVHCFLIVYLPFSKRPLWHWAV